MPFGYKNAPKVFMRRIDEIITKRKLRERVKAFVDDINTHGGTWQQYLEAQQQILEAQQQILEALEEANWLVTVEKMFPRL